MGKRRPSGDGMVRKRDDGRWEGRIVVGHKANGDPIFRHVYAKTQKALTEKLHQSIECYQDVELTEDSRMTLGEWLDRWLAEYKDGTIRPGTLEGYRNYIENYIKPQLGGKQVSLITTQDVQRMYRRLKSGGRVREDAEGSKRLSDSTVRHIHTMLHGAMKAAVQAHIIPKNPTENATVPKSNYKPMQVLNEQELDTFLQAVQKDDIWRDFFYTELMTGLRRGEICAHVARLRREGRDAQNLPDAAQQGAGHLCPRRYKDEPGQPHDHPAGERCGAAAGAEESLHQPMDFPTADQSGAADESGNGIPAAQNAAGGSGPAEHSLP